MNTKVAARMGKTGALPVVLLLLAPAALPAESGPLLQSADGPQLPAPPPLPAVHAELEGLEGEPFRARAAELLAGADPTVVLDAILLRAGRPAPPGLGGARAERRAARQAEARAWMADHDRWITRARDLVAAPGTDEDLRCAALSSLGEAGQLRVARDLAWALGKDRFSPRVRECARDALLRLTGRRFRDAEHYAAVSAGWSARNRAGIFADELLAQEREIEELKVALLEGDPSRIADAFQKGTPALRVAAAGVAARGVGRQGHTLEDALGLLFERLEAEHHPDVLHGTLEALAGLLEGLDPDAAAVQRARDLLTRGGLATRLELAPSIAHAFARLPVTGDGLASSAAQVAGLVALLADEDRPVDYEALSLGLDALEQLLGRETKSAATIAAVAPAREVVLDLLAREAVPAQVQLEAARAAGWVLTTASFEKLLDRLDQADSERLQMELLGSVARLAEGLDPEQSEPDRRLADRLLRELEELIGAPGVDLRRHAIEFLGGEPLEGLRQYARLKDMPELLVTRLGEEPLPAVRDALIDALTDLGTAADQAKALVALPGFDVFLDENHRRAQAMAICLRSLVGKDPDAVALLVARRFARDERETPPETAASSVDRLRGALMVATGPGEATVVSWPAADHGLVLGWALELLAAGASPDLEVLDRLIGVHLDHATEVAVLDVARLLVARDLRRITDGVERDGAEVEAIFELALAEAGERGGALLVRARWRMDSGDVAASVADWDELLFPEAATEPVAGFRPADMRRARVAYADDPVRAARVGLALVSDSAWPALDPGVRLADLLAMADLALASGIPGLQRTANGHLHGVPAPEEGDALPAFPAGTLWSDTLHHKADHEALWRRAEALREALAPPPPADGSGDGAAKGSEGGEEDGRP